MYPRKHLSVYPHYTCIDEGWTLQISISWWRHQMETFSALLAICAGNSLVTAEFPAQRPVTRSFDVFFNLGLNKRLSKQLWGWWFETPSRPLCRHCNDWVAVWIQLFALLLHIILAFKRATRPWLLFDNRRTREYQIRYSPISHRWNISSLYWVFLSQWYL